MFQVDRTPRISHCIIDVFDRLENYPQQVFVHRLFPLLQMCSTNVTNDDGDLFIDLLFHDLSRDDEGE